MSDWRNSAACLHEDPELFFNEGTGYPSQMKAEEAKAVCGRCPVRTPCLAWAVSIRDQWAVCGGTTPAERRPLIDELPVQPKPVKARLRQCAHCPKQFEPLPDWPNGRLCAECRSLHNDPRSRDPQARRAVSHVH